MKKILPSIPAMLARLQFWHKASAAPEDSSAEALPPTDAPPTDLPPPTMPPGGTATVEDEDDAPQKPPLAKRILVVLIRKSVWIPLAALLLIGLSAGISTAIMRAKNAGEEKNLQSLQAEKQKLEEENRKLREQAAAKPLIIPAPDKPAETEHQAEPIQEKPAPASQSKRKETQASADCFIGGKDQAGESLKRCIETFNQLDR